MPFFGQKFLQKKVLRRKVAVLQTDHGNSENDYAFNNVVTLYLGDLKASFVDGRWISRKSLLRGDQEVHFLFMELSESRAENLSLKNTIHHLEEENNLLKLKNEILLDLVGNLKQGVAFGSNASVFELGKIIMAKNALKPEGVYNKCVLKQLTQESLAITMRPALTPVRVNSMVKTCKTRLQK